MIPYLTARSMGMIPASMTESQYANLSNIPATTARSMYGMDIDKYNQLVAPSGGNADPFANPTVTQTTNTQTNPGAGVTDYSPLVDAWNTTTAMGNNIGTAGDKWDQMRAERAARGPADNTPNPNAGPTQYPSGRTQGQIANAKQAAPLYGMSRAELLTLNDPQRIQDNREMLTKMAQQQYGSRYNMAPAMQYLKMMGDGQIKGWTPTQATGTGAAAPTTPQTTQPGGTSVLDVLRNSYGNTPIPGGGMDTRGGGGPTNPGMYGNPIGDTTSPFSPGPNGQTMVNFQDQNAYMNYQSQNPYGATGNAWFGPTGSPNQGGGANFNDMSEPGGSGWQNINQPQNQWQPTQPQMSTPNNVGHSYQPLNNALMQQRQPMDYKQGGGWQNKVTQPWQNWGG